MNKIVSRGPKADPCGTLYFNCLMLHSILQVRTKPVIYYASNSWFFWEVYHGWQCQMPFVSQEILHKCTAQNHRLA